MTGLKGFCVAAPPWVLALVLTTSAVAKAIAGWRPQLILGATEYWFVVSLECILVVGLACGRWRILAAHVVMVIAAAGIVLAYSAKGPCGCMGVWWTMSRVEHIMLASGIGLLALGVLLVDRRTSTEQALRLRTPDC